MEGKSYWLLKSAPISAYELLSGKFVAGDTVHVAHKKGEMMFAKG